MTTLLIKRRAGADCTPASIVPAIAQIARHDDPDGAMAAASGAPMGVSAVPRAHPVPAREPLRWVKSP
jgi:hypothetical protein